MRGVSSGGAPLSLAPRGRERARWAAGRGPRAAADSSNGGLCQGSPGSEVLSPPAAAGGSRPSLLPRLPPLRLRPTRVSSLSLLPVNGWADSEGRASNSKLNKDHHRHRRRFCSRFKGSSPLSTSISDPRPLVKEGCLARREESCMGKWCARDSASVPSTDDGPGIALGRLPCLPFSPPPMPQSLSLSLLVLSFARE